MSPAAQFFSTPRTPVCDLPHVITALDAELIGKVVHLTKGKPGLWPLAAPFDENDVYDRARESAPFQAWALPTNQAEVLSFGLLTQESVFGVKLMMLDASVDEATLRRLATPVGERKETGAYVTGGFQDLPTLPELLEHCGWALIPVGAERGKAVFVTSPSHSEWVAKLEEWCERRGRNRARVRMQDGTLVLEERPATPVSRDNAMAQRVDSFLGGMETHFGVVDESVLPLIGQRIGARRKLQQDIARSKQFPPAS